MSLIIIHGKNGLAKIRPARLIPLHMVCIHGVNCFLLVAILCWYAGLISLAILVVVVVILAIVVDRWLSVTDWSHTLTWAVAIPNLVQILRSKVSCQCHETYFINILHMHLTNLDLYENSRGGLWSICMSLFLCFSLSLSPSPLPVLSLTLRSRTLILDLKKVNFKLRVDEGLVFTHWCTLVSSWLYINCSS